MMNFGNTECKQNLCLFTRKLHRAPFSPNKWVIIGISVTESSLKFSNIWGSKLKTAWKNIL